LDRCFAADVVEANGQPFLFKPRPSRPPLLIGGQPANAFPRALAHPAGWIPMGLTPELPPAPAAELRRRAADAGQPVPAITVLTMLPLGDAAATRDTIAAFGDAGATRVVQGGRYETLDDFRRNLDVIATLR